VIDFGLQGSNLGERLPLPIVRRLKRHLFALKVAISYLNQNPATQSARLKADAPNRRSLPDLINQFNLTSNSNWSLNHEQQR
jgi:hypothetical protein